jgi:multiple antibiotic resistance protein
MGAFFFVALSTIFTIVNPVGALGPFLAMTIGEDSKRRNEMARRSAIVSGAILAVCCAAGSVIFRFYGITIPALKIAGGVLLFFVAFDMINARTSRSKQTAEEQKEGTLKEDIAVFPMAIPLLSGPGAIVSVLVLADKAHGLEHQLAIYGAIAVTSFISFLTLREAHRVVRIMGQIGINLMSRLMGLVLAAIATQFILDGLKTAMPALVS